jgi:CubicO group peptidase (beta-lactamase class C family)
VLVARHGKIVSERYYHGTHADDRLPIFSVTKSVTSALVGPRDLLAFGQLYLDGGVWHGKRIVPARWVRLSTRAYARITPGLGYRYGWWIRPHSFAAYGYLGQVLAVYPRRDEVVLVTSSREDAKARELVRRIAGE